MTPDEVRARRNRRGIVLAVTMGLLAIAAPFMVSLGAFMTIASDACSGDPDRPICSPATQQLVWQIPAVAVVAGLLVGGLAGGFAVKRDRRPYLWLVLAWALPVAALVVSGKIAGAE